MQSAIAVDSLNQENEQPAYSAGKNLKEYMKKELKNKVKLLVLTMVAPIAILNMTACTKSEAVAGAVKTASSSQMTRGEFKSLVLGKTKQEVIKTVGRPKRTMTASFGEVWFYENVTVDDITSKVDYRATLEFAPDAVSKVDFY